MCPILAVTEQLPSAFEPITSGVATIAYVMTEPNYRGKGLGKTIVGHLAKELMNEGFDVFLIYYSDKAGRLYLNHGFKNVCRYGKLYKNV